MKDWHFNIIKERCVEIDTCVVCWDSSQQEYLYANVYGLIGVRVSTKERCMSNFFIQYGRKVYQTFYLLQVSNILELLKKEYLYDRYRCQKNEIRNRKRQKLPAKKRNNGKT